MITQPDESRYNILRAGHVALQAPELEEMRRFYVDLLGLVVTEETEDRIYLRGYEERYHHSLVLMRGQETAVDHMAYQVAGPQDLERLERDCREAGLTVQRVPAGEQRGHGEALRVRDPAGLPLEFYHEMDRAERLLQQFDRYRGAHVMRLDHFNVQAADVSAAYDWYMNTLGFHCSEYIASDEEPPPGDEEDTVWGIWLHRKQNIHDVALMNGKGPRFHHAGFWVKDTRSVLWACDILAAAGYQAKIERGPGRHGVSNAFFVYLRDPAGHRIELYTGDYMIPEPDWEPLRWHHQDPKARTFWGHLPPASWYDEASRVLDAETGEKVPLEAPVLSDDPDDRPQVAM